jgi:hypothetical protein
MRAAGHLFQIHVGPKHIRCVELDRLLQKPQDSRLTTRTSDQINEDGNFSYDTRPPFYLLAKFPRVIRNFDASVYLHSISIFLYSSVEQQPGHSSRWDSGDHS